MVLLIRHDHVGDKWTLRGQEADRQLNSFAMPELTILPLKGDTLYDFVLLMQKSKFCAETEVTDTEETNFFEDILSGQFDDECVC
jgi:hypothetical protein